jgi:hypothetical protein
MSLATLRPSTHRVGLTGPGILIALGLILLLDQIVPGWNIGKTWPVLLVVIGVLRLIDSGRSPQPPEGPRL